MKTRTNKHLLATHVLTAHVLAARVLAAALFVYVFIMMSLYALAVDAPDDVPSSWAKDGVNRAISLKLVRDDIAGMYARQITRAEFCGLVVSLYEGVRGEEISVRKTFNDTNNTDVEKAAGIEVVLGVSNDRFDPDGKLTREQAAVMLSRLAEVIGKPLAKGDASFVDSAKISSWASAQVGQVQAAGIMSGVGNNVFDPQGDYTREQSITTVLRLYDLLELPLKLRNSDYTTESKMRSIIGGKTSLPIDSERENAVFATLNGLDVKIYEYKLYYSLVKSDVLFEADVRLDDAETEALYLAMEINEGVTMGDYIKERALVELRRYKVLAYFAKDRGTELDDDDWAFINDTIQSQIDSFGGQEALEISIFDDYGISLASYIKLFVQNQINEKCYNEIYKETDYTEEEISAEYEMKHGYFENLTVRHILFMPEGEDGDRTAEETLHLAESILARVQAGEDMTMLAEQYSEDFSAVDNGGEYTFNRYDDFVQELLDWGFAAKIGESGIVKTDFGYHVILKEDETVTSLEAAREDLISSIRNQKISQRFEEVSSSDEFKWIINEDIFSTIQIMLIPLSQNSYSEFS